MKQQDSIEKAGAVLQETIMNIKTVQACNGETTMVYFLLTFYLVENLA